MIDLHAHLLPKVDDGAQNIEDSLELARIAVSEGVTDLVVTPHHLNGRYVNPAQSIIKATRNLQTEYDQVGIKLKVYPGQEIRITEKFFDYLYNDELLSLDGGERYYLIEFPTEEIPKYSVDIIEEMIRQGMTPVIAHPERNHVFAKNLIKLADFIEMGCLGQITSSCISGYYGEQLQNHSRAMITANLTHVIASDVHHVKSRPFNLNAAFNVIKEEFGVEMVEYLQNNACQIINGNSVQVKSIELNKEPLQRKKWFKFFDKIGR